MPSYAYRCKKCGKPFTLTMPIREHEKKRVRCLKCGSNQVAKLVQSFNVTTSKKS
jgi:putative FmdB family regulatory protein